MSVSEILGYVLLAIACLLGAGLLLLIILLITTSITVKIRYDGETELRVKYLFFTIVRSPETPSRIRRKKKKRLKELKKKEKLRRKNRKAAHLKTNEKKSSRRKNPNEDSSPLKEKDTDLKKGENIREAKTADNAPKINSSKKERSDKKAKVDFQAAMGLINSAKPHIKRVFKKIRITDVLVDIMVGGEDAAKTALSYGVHCCAIYGLIEFLKQNVTFEADRITIKADFDLPKTDYYARATIKLKISTFLRCVLWGIVAAAKELNGSSPQSGKQTKVKNQPLKKAG